MRQGEIYVVKFDPSTGHEYKKTRPAIVIQSEEISDISSLVTVMPISSRVDKCQDPDIPIAKDEKNRLAQDSVIMVRQISTFDYSRFLRKIGEANSPTLRKVRGYLRKHFTL
ncbi:MAG: type II toxin-antitoxin system PemK/MazF family toxin [Candidatus Uhrbacteria bacterium]|nr:type II toxin-antitoxin system PemK/MazF family toxin [Candidatus Uhrbacteria bacterium]